MRLFTNQAGMTKKPIKPVCLVAVTVVLGCLVLAACGSGRLSKTDYRSQLAVIVNGNALAHNALSLGAANVQTVPQLQTKLRRLASAEDQLGDELSALKAPKDAVAANAALAKGEHDDAAELRRLIPRLSTFSGPRQALHFLNRIGHTNGGREEDEAIAKLEKLGYTTGVQPSSAGAP
jgi:hypothetical protein